MRAVGRVMVTLVGFLAAVIAAAAFMMLARLGRAPLDPDVAVFFWGHFAVGLGVAASMLGAAALVPAFIAILASEILALRSIVFYLAAGAALALAAVFGLSPMIAPMAGASGRATLMLAAGVIGGAVYWAVAGRTAGLTPPNRPPPPGPPAD